MMWSEYDFNTEHLRHQEQLGVHFSSSSFCLVPCWGLELYIAVESLQHEFIQVGAWKPHYPKTKVYRHSWNTGWFPSIWKLLVAVFPCSSESLFLPSKSESPAACCKIHPPPQGVCKKKRYLCSSTVELHRMCHRPWCLVVITVLGWMDRWMGILLLPFSHTLRNC